MRARFTITLLLGLAACGDSNNNNTQKDAAIDAPAVDAGVDASCFTNPKTHVEILNACTTWQSVDKVPVTPLRNPDGSLPTLPN